jgi:hypothetical protein
VQTAPDPSGGSRRWVFSELAPNSFRWTAERFPHDGNWRREVAVHARRVQVDQSFLPFEAMCHCYGYRARGEPP